MNILFVGHGIKYVEFYAAIERVLRKRVNLSSIHVYFLPSAWIYAKLVLGLTANCPWLYRFFSYFKIDSQLNKDAIDLRFYSDFGYGNNSKPLERLYEEYFNYFKNLLKKKIDLVVLPGEYRLFEQATLAAIKSMSHPPIVIYFEAGPPGYVYFDKRGVNANASFAVDLCNKNCNPNTPHFDVQESQYKAKLRLLKKLFLAIDILWLVFAKITGALLDLEEYWLALKSRVKRFFYINTSIFHKSSDFSGDRVVVFLAQVRHDVNHTHFGISDIELEKNLNGLLSSDNFLKLIWRDHPLEDSNQLFNRITKSFPGRVVRAKNLSLYQLMKVAEGVVTVNSNGGLEALIAGLPVRVLGRSYYSRLNGVCFDNSSFAAERKFIHDFGPNPIIRSDAERFLREYFFPINYRDGDFKNSYMAADFIFSLIK